MTTSPRVIPMNRMPIVSPIATRRADEGLDRGVLALPIRNFSPPRKKARKKRQSPRDRKKPSRSRYQNMCPLEEAAVDTEKHPQSTSNPRAELNISVAKNMRKRELATSAAPGNQNPEINKRPRSSSSQGRKMAVRLIRAWGRI